MSGRSSVSQAAGFSVAWIRKSYRQSAVASRSSVRSCTTSSSSSASGSTAFHASTCATAFSSDISPWRAKLASVTARSCTSGACTMSPKSMTPTISSVPDSARSRLSAWPSLCTTCARKEGRRGRTSRWKRALMSAHSSLVSLATQAWMPGSRSSARWMSQATKWRACGWKNPRNPRASFAWKAAAWRSALIPSGLLCDSGVPGSQLSSRTMWRLPSSAAIHSRSLPLDDAMTRGTGRSWA